MSDPIDISKLPTFMLREIVAGETKLQPEEVMPGDTTRPDNAAPQGSEPPAGAAERPKLTMQEARELSADIARRAEERRKAAVALECTPPPQPPGGTPEVDAEWDRLKAAHLPEHFSQQRAPHWYRVAANLKEFADSLEHHRNEARAALAAAEQRAEGAEKQLAELRDWVQAAQEIAKPKFDALTAQRDTAIRERDEAVARVRFLESIQANPSDIPETAELKADLRAALAAKTTEDKEQDQTTP